MMGTATLALIAGASSESLAFGKGVYLGATVGYTHNKAKVEKKDSAKEVLATLNSVVYKTVGGTFTNKASNAFNGTLFVGFDRTFGDAWLFDTRFFGSYDTANAKIMDFTQVQPNAGGAAIAVTNGKGEYRPQFGVGLGFYFGRMLNEKIAGFLGLAAEYNFAKMKIGGTIGGKRYDYTDNIQVFSLTPSLGLKGHINEKMSWLAEVGYKFGLSASGMHKDLNLKFKDKPSALVVKVGASYHF